MSKIFKLVIKKKNFILVWLTINLFVSLIFFSLLSTNRNVSLVKLFVLIFISCNIISTMTVVTGYSIGGRVNNGNLAKAISSVLVATTTATVVGIIISYLISKYIFKIIVFSTMKSFWFNLFIPSIIISVIASVIATTIEVLKYKNRELLKEIQNKKMQKKSISIKEQDKYYMVDFADIIYLSSSAKRTMIHTEKKDFETIKLLKEVEMKLPGNKFIRIHKKYIINTKYLSHIEYYQGGQYFAYLKDDDETILPVGRTFVCRVKENLSI